jgi:hypothetical protein
MLGRNRDSTMTEFDIGLDTQRSLPKGFVNMEKRYS